MAQNLTIALGDFEENYTFRSEYMAKYGITSRIENETELIFEKIFEAPQEKLFEVFTTSEHLEQFWGPHGWELIHSTMDFQPDGEWFYGMKCVDESQQTHGMESWGKTMYEKIDRPNQFVYRDYFADKHGELNRELPVAETTMDFVALDNDRTIVSNRTKYNTPEELQALIDNGMLQGMAEMWDGLSEYLTTI